MSKLRAKTRLHDAATGRDAVPTQCRGLHTKTPNYHSYVDNTYFKVKFKMRHLFERDEANV